MSRQPLFLIGKNWNQEEDWQGFARYLRRFTDKNTADKIQQIGDEFELILRIADSLAKYPDYTIFINLPDKIPFFQELVFVLKSKNLSVQSFAETTQSTGKSILLTFGTQYGSPIHNAENNWPQVALVVGFSVHSHIIGGVTAYRLVDGEYHAAPKNK